MPIQVICKFHKDPMKNERTMPCLMLTMEFFNNQGQITKNNQIHVGTNTVCIVTNLMAIAPHPVIRSW